MFNTIKSYNLEDELENILNELMNEGQIFLNSVSKFQFKRDELFIGTLERNSKGMSYVMINGEKIIIDLDGTYGYPPSFLEEAFGGLVRAYPAEDFSQIFEFITFDEPELKERIANYIKNGNADSKARR